MSDTYKHLTVWKDSVTFATEIYSATREFPQSELFGLTSQLRRAAVSVAANLAEGAGRNSKKDFARFVDIALGSLNEVETLLKIAENIGYLSSSVYSGLFDSTQSIGKALGGLRKYLKHT